MCVGGGGGGILTPKERGEYLVRGTGPGELGYARALICSVEVMASYLSVAFVKHPSHTSTQLHVQCV